MSEHQFNGAYSLGYGDGLHDAARNNAKSNSIWFVGGIALGLAMGIALHFVSTGRVF